MSRRQRHPNTPLTTAADINYSNVNGLGTLTLVAGGSWADLGFTQNSGIFISSTIDPNSNGATFNASSSNPYYTIGSISGNVMTLTAALTVNGGTSAQATMNVTPVVINATPSLSTLKTGTTTTYASTQTVITPTIAGPLTNATVNFGNSGASGTITLTSGTWSNSYQIGDAIFISSPTDRTPTAPGRSAPPQSTPITRSPISAEQRSPSAKR